MNHLVKPIIIMCAMAIFLMMPSNTYALSWSEIDSQAKSFINNGEGQGGQYIQASDMNSLVSGLANILTTVGVVIVLAGLLIIGIKYMMATPEEASKLKTKLVGLAVSGVVIIGAYGIWSLACRFFGIA